MIGKHCIYVFTVSEEMKLTKEIVRSYNCALNNNVSGAGTAFRFYTEKLNVGYVFYLGKVSGQTSSNF